MTDWGKPCTETEGCTLHNLHCGYPNCKWGRAERKKEYDDKCPDCGAPLESGPNYSGVVCSEKCGYWFCY